MAWSSIVLALTHEVELRRSSPRQQNILRSLLSPNASTKGDLIIGIGVIAQLVKRFG
jgi:hypothetical protein